MKVLCTHICRIVILLTGLTACNTARVNHSAPDEETIFRSSTGEPVTIANDSLEYEIIIIEPGFDAWLNSVARPEGYYSQSFLENRNQVYVVNWNQRVREPHRYNPDLYGMIIDYDPHIDYGYEVNYKLYCYFIYFQRKYRQQLAGFIPRI
ncbi:DUF6146 family protein [Sinomicrobium soli]|uniref:DUF6146 family protein n=1 Tax=Sinomicrobium sp. N-1-3-6 TaxID=2219864 RepID=UPI000DCC7705|nr:DUF6146 family protein [Sinomicrobium sp. N-1-3-6]RAV27840.1 hypothetical protein DN748_16385 [Sinomicrobium sp. N-1-3-6]